MADPTTPTTTTTTTTTTIPVYDPTYTQAQINGLNALTDASEKATDAQNNYNTISSKAIQTISDLSKQAATWGVNLGNMNSLTVQQTEQMALLTAGAIKARESFAGLSGIDYGGFSGIGQAFKDIQEAVLSGGTALSDGVAAAVAAAKALKVSDADIDKARSQGGEKALAALMKLGQGMITHADNAQRGKLAIIQMAAATGDLSSLWTQAGSNLSGLNAVFQKNTDMIGASTQATGKSDIQVQQYWAALGKIPGALDAVVNTGAKGAATTSMLTAAMQVADGTGRSFADIVDGMTTAFRDYNLVGEDALKFSTRMTDVSTNLKAPLEDVKRALTGSADAFKEFASGGESAARTTEGLAEVYNTYGKALESTGLSANTSLDIIGQMTNHIKDLSIAQKAYLSQQIGGAGGLAGGFQIEQRLQSGDVAGVFRDVIKSIKQQTGGNVSLEQAQQSQAAAGQLQKQIMMLTSGPLGGLVKNQEEAIKALQASNNIEAGKKEAQAPVLPVHTVQDAANRGLEWQKSTYTDVHAIRSTVDKINLNADVGAGNIAARSMTAADTGDGTMTLAQGGLKTFLTTFMEAGRNVVPNQPVEGKAIEGGRTGQSSADLIKNLVDVAKSIPNSLKSVWDEAAAAIKSGDRDKIRQSNEVLKSVSQRDKEQSSQLVNNPAAAARASAEASAADKLLAMMKTTMEGNSVPASGQVKKAARGNIAEHAAATQTAHQTNQPIGTPTAKHEQIVNLVAKIAIDCPHCGKPSDVSDQAKIHPQQFAVKY